MCSTWGQTCKACGKQNHFDKVWHSKGDEKWGGIRYVMDEEAAMEALIGILLSNQHL